MQKLADLSRFLVSLNLFAVEGFDSWVENPKIVPSGQLMGNGGIVLFRHEYDAVFAIERFNHAAHPAELLFGHFCAWILQNDDRDNIAEPQIQMDVLDDEVAEIEISIDFREDVTAVEDPGGPIELNGIRYRLDTPVINVALLGELGSQ